MEVVEPDQNFNMTMNEKYLYNNIYNYIESEPKELDRWQEIIYYYYIMCLYYLEFYKNIDPNDLSNEYDIKRLRWSLYRAIGNVPSDPSDPPTNNAAESADRYKSKKWFKPHHAHARSGAGRRVKSPEEEKWMNEYGWKELTRWLPIGAPFGSVGDGESKEVFPEGSDAFLPATEGRGKGGSGTYRYGKVGKNKKAGRAAAADPYTRAFKGSQEDSDGYPGGGIEGGWGRDDSQSKSVVEPVGPTGYGYGYGGAISKKKSSKKKSSKKKKKSSKKKKKSSKKKSSKNKKKLSKKKKKSSKTQKQKITKRKGKNKKRKGKKNT